MAGRSVIDPQVVEALVRRRTRQATLPRSCLSPRELDELREMALGKTNAAIAGSPVLAGSSVEQRVNAILQRLGLSEEARIHRRLAAVLAFLRDSDREAP